ncbi:MAG: hypothetical protein PHX51_07700 [Clostridia bacterium]|nr:hypothetical protein [Clostridia bacterium]
MEQETKSENKVIFAIKKDKTGYEYVEVIDRALNEVDVDNPKLIVKTLSDIVETKFCDLVNVNCQAIRIQSRTAKEWVYSKSAVNLRRFSKQAFIDKANAFGSADELLKVSKGYIGEAIKHQRTDNFVEFARGTVSFQIEERGYEADIIVGTTKNRAAVLYDIVNIQGKKIVAESLGTAQDRRHSDTATISGGRTPSASATALAGTSETNGRNSTTDSISDSGKNVNNNNVRYALNVGGDTFEVESQKGKNLVALHNLSEENLIKVIELGGFPMPSIAITKTELPHNDFGDITVIFGKDTIDPQSNISNKVYAGDAWTPIVPQKEYLLNENTLLESANNLTKIAEEVFSGYAYEIKRFLDQYRENNGEYVITEKDLDNVGRKAMTIQVCSQLKKS